MTLFVFCFDHFGTSACFVRVGGCSSLFLREILDAIDTLHIDTLVSRIEQGLDNASTVVPVAVSQQFLEVFGSFAGVVMGYLEFNVVQNMGRADLVMQVIDQPRVRSVNGGQSAAQPRESFFSQVRHVWMRVVQERVQNQPHVHKDVGEEIITGYIRESKRVRGRAQDADTEDE